MDDGVEGMVKIWFVLVLLTIFVIPVSAENWNLRIFLEETMAFVEGLTPDGSKILCLVDTDGNPTTYEDIEVFLINVETGNVERITYDTHFTNSCIHLG